MSKLGQFLRFYGFFSQFRRETMLKIGLKSIPTLTGGQPGSFKSLKRYFRNRQPLVSKLANLLILQLSPTRSTGIFKTVKLRRYEWENLVIEHCTV